MQREEIAQLIEDCENRESKMTVWERSFIQSLSDQVSNRSLSDNQIQTLEKIWERIT